MRKRLTKIVLAAALWVWVPGCNRDTNAEHALPVAQSWSAKTPLASSVPQGATAGGQTSHGHAGDPHAGLDMGGMGGMGGDPHAGLDMGGMGGMGGDPHAGLDMDGMGGMEDPAMAAVQPPDPERTIDRSRFLRGTITATAATTSRVPAGSILFISVKPVNLETGDVLGAPLAVDRIDIQKLPVTFELTEEHAMSAGTELVGDVLITARVDQDGEARSAQAGDVEGRATARIPATGISIELDTVVQ